MVYSSGYLLQKRKLTNLVDINEKEDAESVFALTKFSLGYGSSLTGGRYDRFQIIQMLPLIQCFLREIYLMPLPYTQDTPQVFCSPSQRFIWIMGESKFKTRRGRFLGGRHTCRSEPFFKSSPYLLRHPIH